ncbi:MAG: hypothetical protein EB090_04130 [Verrucomicrobia bacterium]|nr:hypothetical protein [Verrucomicrobiota bacterium]
MNTMGRMGKWLRRNVRTLVGIFLTAVSQFVLAYVTLSIQAIYPVWSAPFWPASGAALAACLLRGPWMLIGVYLGLTLPNLTLWAPTPSWIAFVLPLGNLAETALAWLLLRLPVLKFDHKFQRIRELGSFLIVAPWIPAAVSAFFVQTSLLAAQPKGRRILFILFGVSFALWIFHSENLPTYLRMTSVLIVPLVVWGIWSTGFRGATLVCLLTSTVYFAFDVPESRPLSTVLNQRHLQANISFIGAKGMESPLNRNLPPPSMLDEALEQIGVLMAVCLTLLPLGVAADELRKRGEQDDLIMETLDSSFWSWTRKDGLQFLNPRITSQIGNHPLLFEATQTHGNMIIPSINPKHPGYVSHWTITDKGNHGDPLTIIGILQSRMETSRRQEAEAKAELANLEVRALRSHLNPHLIFNCLTGLRGMIKANPDLARDFTGRLARFLRAVVDSQVSTLITLDHELEICQDYIRLEAIRGRSISFSHHPDPSEKSVFLPPLSVVTLVENAVKHGTSDAEGHLAIHFECRPTSPQTVSLVVRHAGSIRSHGKGDIPGGLSLLSKQLKVSYSQSSGVELVGLPNDQVEARIQLPLQVAA